MLDTDLMDVLGPVRDVHVAAILESMAAELSAGADVDAEPVDRDGEGRIRRRAPLGLPSRCDLRVRREGRMMTLRALSSRWLCFDPIGLPLSDRAAARVAPFRWGAATVEARHALDKPDWTPVRLWYLEWFQARFGEESPDLLGVVHALEGPQKAPDGWRFTVDLGSASVAGFVAMLHAFGSTGCADIRVGEAAIAV